MNCVGDSKENLYENLKGLEFEVDSDLFEDQNFTFHSRELC